MLACSARVHEAAGILVLLGVQHIGALGAELEGDLLGVFLGARVGGSGGAWGGHLVCLGFRSRVRRNRSVMIGREDS